MRQALRSLGEVGKHRRRPFLVAQVFNLCPLGKSLFTPSEVEGPPAPLPLLSQPL